MSKLFYFGLVTIAVGSIAFVSIKTGVLSTAYNSGLTADFKLVTEIPINGDKDNKVPTSKATSKKAGVVSAAVILVPPTKIAPLAPNPAIQPPPAGGSAPVVAPATYVAVAPVPQPPPVGGPVPAPTPEPTPDSTLPTSSGVGTPTDSVGAAPEPAPAPTPEPTPPPPAPEPIRVEISAIQTGTTAGGSKDEFVKLYNPTNSEIDLAGWVLDKKASTGNLSHLVSSGAFSGKIAAHGYFVIANAAYSGSKDLVYSANSNDLSYTDNSAVLYYSDGSVMDVISWGDPGIPKDTIWTRE